MVQHPEKINPADRCLQRVITINSETTTHVSTCPGEMEDTCFSRDWPTMALVGVADLS